MVEDLAPQNAEGETENSDFQQEHEGHGLNVDEAEVLDDVLCSSPILKEKEATEEEEERNQPGDDVETSNDDSDENKEGEEESLSEHVDESPKHDRPSTSTSLSQQEFSELKSKNPFEAFKLLMSGKSSTESKQSASTASGGGDSVSSQEDLIKELQRMLFQTDLIKAIEEDQVITFKIKELLSKLNTPASSPSLIGFILEFEPFLEAVTREVQKKKSIAAKKERAKELHQEAWSAVEASNTKLNDLQARKETLVSQASREIAEYDAAIAELQQQIKTLQQKKASVQKETLSLEGAINEEATSALEFFEAASLHESTVNKLVEEEAFINTKLEQSQSVLLKMKMDLRL